MSDRNTIPPTLADLLVKLGYLAAIPNQKKACFGDLSYVDANAWIGSFKRYRDGESRENMLVKVNQIIDQAIEEVDKYSGTQYLPLLITKLANTEIGINNLIDTYNNDPNVILHLQTCKTKIELKLKPLRKYIESKLEGKTDDDNSDTDTEM